MAKLEVTKDFRTFVDSVFIESYNEVYDLYQAASGNPDGQSTYQVEPCKGSDDILIIHEPSQNALRLSPKACAYFPEWIQDNLMDGLDVETYWGMEHAKEKDEQEEKRHLDF